MFCDCNANSIYTCRKSVTDADELIFVYYLYAYTVHSLNMTSAQNSLAIDTLCTVHTLYFAMNGSCIRVHVYCHYVMIWSGI